MVGRRCRAAQMVFAIRRMRFRVMSGRPGAISSGLALAPIGGVDEAENGFDGGFVSGGRVEHGVIEMAGWAIPRCDSAG